MSIAGASRSDPRRLISAVVEELYVPTEAELRRALRHVAWAGFDPEARERAGSRGSGVGWQGRIVQPSDRLPPAVVHYLRHVVKQPEWPVGTSLDQYLASIREVVEGSTSGVLVSRFQGKVWQVAVVRRSETLRGPAGSDWVLVEYRVETEHWVTAFQPKEGLAYLDAPSREHRRWLRRPK